eukprot:4227495-Lingulodinium_polyedra.AAC.1
MEPTAPLQHAMEEYHMAREAARAARDLEAQTAEDDVASIVDCLLKPGSGHAVPPWSVPRRVWSKILREDGCPEMHRALCRLCRS